MPTVVATLGTINRDVAVVATGTGFSIFYETNGDNTGGIDIRQNDFALDGTSLSFANLTGPTSGTSTAGEFNPSAVLLDNGIIALSYEASGDAFVQIVSERTTGPRSAPLEVNGGANAANQLTDTDITRFVESFDSLPRLLVAMEDLDDGQVVGEILSYVRVVSSDAESDTLVALPGIDSFVGGDGIDTVDYSATTSAVQVDRSFNPASLAALGDLFSSIERFIGTDFDDTLGGSQGDDTLEGGDGADFLFGRAGVDLIRGDAGADTIFGGDGDDTLNGGSGDDTLNGGIGNDSISGSSGNDAIDGAEGDDIIRGFENNDVISGGDGHDSLFGGIHDDTLYGGGGNDTLRGSRDDDALYGGDGDDRLYSDGDPSDGVDTGVNRLFGEAGNDTLIGEDGQDILDGGTGADSMNGGRGNDFYIVDNVADIVTETLAFSAGGGIDTVRAFIDYVQPTNIELVRLGNLTDTISLDATGNDAPGTLVGNAGNNTLTGRGGNDQINGNDGDDVLIGNTGRDTLVGGAGADTFIYSSISESRTGAAERDVINGFDRGADLIDLSAMDANLGAAGDAAFSFIGTTGFSGTAGELRLQGLGGPNAVLVEGDLRGDGVADFQIFVNLTTVLGAEYFIL